MIHRSMRDGKGLLSARTAARRVDDRIPSGVDGRADRPLHEGVGPSVCWAGHRQIVEQYPERFRNRTGSTHR